MDAASAARTSAPARATTAPRDRRLVRPDVELRAHQIEKSVEIALRPLVQQEIEIDELRAGNGSAPPGACSPSCRAATRLVGRAISGAARSARTGNMRSRRDRTPLPRARERAPAAARACADRRARRSASGPARWSVGRQLDLARQEEVHVVRSTVVEVHRGERDPASEDDLRLEFGARDAFEYVELPLGEFRRRISRFFDTDLRPRRRV